MDVNAYIDSGILELYVAGALSEKENEAVYALIQEHPEILQEVLAIESAVLKLTAAASPAEAKSVWEKVKSEIHEAPKETESPKVITLKKAKYNWVTYTGWAASIVLAAGLLWTLNQNRTLKTDIKTAETQQSELELQIEKSRNNLEETQTLLSVLRDAEIKQVPLEGQGDFTNTYAKVYWDKDQQRVFIDAQGLPDPPRGKVYQVWSLKLSPLTPTSLGTIAQFDQDANKIFELPNPNDSEAFGITLEPAGGSETPTMEQLYTLGVVKAS
ncbi:anti-sigma factor [Gaetbulibacter aestuarii]|uniref:Anti-sigma factor n=1 Tax=Gaetbulibacter aestuarii TaxID=1502358 RepID=A0ABW7N0D1_9FLAO